MQNKTFESCKAKPLNIRTLPHKDFIPRTNMQVGKVYRLCNIEDMISSIPNLKDQLGEGTYYFVPILPAVNSGIVVVKRLDGQLVLPTETELLYVAHIEGLFKLRSTSDKALETLILTAAKSTKVALKYSYVFNWD